MANVSGYVVSAVSAPALEHQYATGQQDDLDASIPDTGIALGGDGATAYPAINIPGVYEGPNPLVCPDSVRPIPTGTAIGPKGQHYGFYSLPAYTSPGFVTQDSTLVDLSNPSVTLATITGVSQASGAYDASTGDMLIVGNTETGRALWQPATKLFGVAWPCMSIWWNHVGPPKYFTDLMNGDRENQIVALPDGGFLLVAAANYQPIICAAAATAVGLLTASPIVLLRNTSFPGGMYPYGPTITSITQIDNRIYVTMRVSTFGLSGYNPQTWTAQFLLTGQA